MSGWKELCRLLEVECPHGQQEKSHGVSRATLDRLLTGKCFGKSEGQTKFTAAEEKVFVDLLLSSAKVEVPLKRYAFRRIIDSRGKSQDTSELID